MGRRSLVTGRVAERVQLQAQLLDLEKGSVVTHPRMLIASANFASHLRAIHQHCYLVIIPRPMAFATKLTDSSDEVQNGINVNCLKFLLAYIKCGAATLRVFRK